MKTERVVAVLGYVMLASYASFILHAWHVSAIVGHWPSYNDPDPNNVPLPGIVGVAIAILWIAALASVVIYPVSLGCLRFLRKAGSERTSGFPWHLLAYVIGLLVWFADRKYFGLLEWELD